MEHRKIGLKDAFAYPLVSLPRSSAGVAGDLKKKRNCIDAYTRIHLMHKPSDA